MSEEQLEYEGKEIVYDEDEEEPMLVIDERDVEVIHEEEGYYTNVLPYAHYSSLREMAEELVDNWREIEPALARKERDGE